MSSKLAAAGTLVLAAVALVGPRARVREEPAEPTVPPLPELDAWLEASEREVPNLRAGDQKQIEWYGAPDSVTELAVVYLHGFSADRHELDPVPRDVAHALGANLFYTRLKGHGRNGAAMGEATAEDWLRDAAEAVEIGRRIGRRVILLGTSTGGTLATWAAAQAGLAGDLEAIVLVSPNFGVRDRRSRLLLWPWGNLIARLIVGRERCFEPATPEQALHWTNCYPTRALLPMMALVEHVRDLDPGRVRTPVLVLFSPQDQVVDPGQTRRVFEALGSETRRMVPVTVGNEGEHHVLAGDIVAPEANDLVESLILDFLRPLPNGSDEPHTNGIR